LVATNLNAFEIIALSAGLDLSGLFIKECRKETRFTSDKTTLAIISKLEDVAKTLNLRIRKKENNTISIQGRKEGAMVSFSLTRRSLRSHHPVILFR
jgi:5'-AMP-activated protein kinase, catalytic alpha subunit